MKQTLTNTLAASFTIAVGLALSSPAHALCSADNGNSPEFTGATACAGPFTGGTPGGNPTENELNHLTTPPEIANAIEWKEIAKFESDPFNQEGDPGFTITFDSSGTFGANGSGTWEISEDLKGDFVISLKAATRRIYYYIPDDGDRSGTWTIEGFDANNTVSNVRLYQEVPFHTEALPGIIAVGGLISWRKRQQILSKLQTMKFPVFGSSENN